MENNRYMTCPRNSKNKLNNNKELLSRSLSFGATVLNFCKIHIVHKGALNHNGPKAGLDYQIGNDSKNILISGHASQNC